jgi:hypothetical protein
MTVSPTKTRTPALDELAALRQAVTAAEAAAETARTERNASARWLPAAQAQLATYLTAVERDAAKRDAEVEKARRDQVTDLQAMRVAIEQVGNSTRYADRRAIARYDDALDLVQDANSDVHTFAIEHRAELQDEMCDRALAARDRLLDSIEELSAATSHWGTVAREWRDLVERWGTPSHAEIPQTPLPGIALQDIVLVLAQVRGGAKDPRGAIPMPASLAPGADDTDRHATPLRGWEHRPRRISSEIGLGT